jgi:hypothetical protein
MTAMRLRLLPRILTGALLVGLAVVMTVAQADERGPISGRASHDWGGPHGWGGSHRWGGREGWHGSRAFFGFSYGEPYDFYDPWYDLTYPFPYYGSPFAYESSSAQPGLASQSAYDLGRDDALNGRPRHYVKGETPGYKGSCRKAYMAGYAKGLLEETQRAKSDRYHPPTHYEPPAAPGEGGSASGA